MMTALNIENRTQEGLRQALSLFRHNKIHVEHSYCDSASLKSINYEHFRGKIGWASIDRFVKAQRNRVLCADGLELPRELGYKRYVPHLLAHKLCENASLWLLRALKGSAKVVLLDKNGESAGICTQLADYADPVYVITENVELYITEAERLLSEKGASLRVSKGLGILLDADLIIAPNGIDAPLPCQPNTVILSGENPQAEAPAPIIYRYFFDLPCKFKEIKPNYLDDMYFAATLYEMSAVKELGGELFSRATDGTVLHTRLSLLEMLRSRVEGKAEHK